jgi:hypothetical protein
MNDAEAPDDAASTSPRPPEGPAGAAPPERRARSERRATDRGATEDRRKRNVPVAVERRSGVDRRSLPDRRAQAGKTAGSYDLDADTLEFIHAVNAFKAVSGKPFPTWSEILQIVRDLGYAKLPRP